MKKYENYHFDSRKADEILEKWGNPDEFAENHHGAVYWNEKTGEILWYGDECNAMLLEESE